MNFTASAVIFRVAIHLQGFRSRIPVESNRFRGLRASYTPVNVFYPSIVLP